MCFRFTDPRVLLPFPSSLSLSFSPFHIEQRVRDKNTRHTKLFEFVNSFPSLFQISFLFLEAPPFERKERRESSLTLASERLPAWKQGLLSTDTDQTVTVVPHDWPANSKQRSEHNVTIESITARLLVCRSEHCRRANQSFAEVIARETMRARGGGRVWRNKLAEEACRKSRLVEKLGRGIVLKTLLPRQCYRFRSSWIRIETEQYSRVYSGARYSFRSGDQIFVEVEEYLIRPPTLLLSFLTYSDQGKIP